MQWGGWIDGTLTLEIGPDAAGLITRCMLGLCLAIFLGLVLGGYCAGRR